MTVSQTAPEDKARDYVLKQLFPKWSYPIANHAPAVKPGAAAGGGTALLCVKYLVQTLSKKYAT